MNNIKKQEEIIDSSTKNLFYTSIRLHIIIHLLIILFVVIHLIYFIFMLVKNNSIKKTINCNKPSNLRKINEECIICLGCILHEVQMPCSHSYCAKCLIDYWDKSYSFSLIQCPICRIESKSLFSNFERNDCNKELYDKILTYNYEITLYPTSFCFCIDMFRLTKFYLSQFYNFNNPRFESYRNVIIILLILASIFTIIQFKNSELLEEVFFYSSIIILCLERLVETYYIYHSRQSYVRFNLD